MRYTAQAIPSNTSCGMQKIAAWTESNSRERRAAATKRVLLGSHPQPSGVDSAYTSVGEKCSAKWGSADGLDSASELETSVFGEQFPQKRPDESLLLLATLGYSPPAIQFATKEILR